MNLYKLHSNPESLDHHDAAHEQLLHLFWEKYVDTPIELKKREQYIAESAEHSYMYAKDILKGPFEVGEEAISKSALYSYCYSSIVLKGPFKAGEAAIATSTMFSYLYAVNVLKGQFKAGEAAIATSPYKDDYEAFVGYEI
jgi:hypothetical protein